MIDAGLVSIFIHIIMSLAWRIWWETKINGDILLTESGLKARKFKGLYRNIFYDYYRNKDEEKIFNTMISR